VAASLVRDDACAGDGGEGLARSPSINFLALMKSLPSGFFFAENFDLLLLIKKNINILHSQTSLIGL
jgi:hypothetical protein